MTEKIAAIVLGAGRGTRINAKTKNKVALDLGGVPMISHTVSNLRNLGVDQIVVVVGFQADSVRQALGDTVDYAIQDPPQGTGDAVKSGLKALDPGITTVLSVYGDDSAFYTPDLFQEVIDKRRQSKADIMVLTITKTDPTGLGRILRNDNGRIIKIVEEKNATEAEKKITEINTGLYCFDRQFLEENINKIEKNEVSGEYYLTDLVEIALESGHKVGALHLDDDSLWHGVNTKEELALARKKFISSIDK